VYEGADEDLLPSLQATIRQLEEDLHLQQEENQHHAAEVLKLEQLLKSMEQSVNLAREEAVQLQQYYSRQVEEMGKGAANGDQVQGLQQLLAQAEAEKKTLKDKLYEQEYLPDVLEEKKLQIDFLQTQLEQRIKNYHNLEQQATHTVGQLQQLQTAISGYEEQVKGLTGELQSQQQQAAEWGSALEHSRKEEQQQQEVIRTKTGQIEQLEWKVQDLQQQQGVLQSEMADQQDTVRGLRERLTDEQQKAAVLEARLEQSQQLFNRIYTDLAQSLGNGEAGIIINTAAAAPENVLELHASS
jgi:chromosome segregation ATPase